MVPGLRVLQDSGIEIEDDPDNIKPLPPYAKELRDLLLNFEGILPLDQVHNAYCSLFSDSC